jgi:hypothetical protein
MTGRPPGPFKAPKPDESPEGIRASNRRWQDRRDAERRKAAAWDDLLASLNRDANDGDVGAGAALAELGWLYERAPLASLDGFRLTTDGGRTADAGLDERCRGCDEPLPADDPGVEAYVMHDDGGERLFLYCSKCARGYGLI